MNKFYNTCLEILTAIVTVAFMFIPESLFEKIKIILNISDDVNIIVNRIIFVVILAIISAIISAIHLKLVKKVIVKGKNYIIQVEYGDLLSIKNCQKVISFDECYTEKIGNAPSEIKPTSICGQYLKNTPDINIAKLIADNNIKPATTRSRFQNKIRYPSGTIVPNGNDLLLAFAMLDKDGRGTFFTYQEFLNCLEKLWEEIDKYYAQKDVCISILGSGQTKIYDNLLTQQQLLDIIIMSYQLHNHKIKKPSKLRIICKKNDDFSLNKIGINL